MRLAALAAAASVVAALPPAAAQQQSARASAPPAKHYTYVIVHGAWGGGWDWRAVDSLLTRNGHHVQRVTLTGLGERHHLASPNVGLYTHIEDVVNTILWENLHDVVLVGHSYGGMVISGVADRVPDRIKRLVYVDALLPDSGESVSLMQSADTGGGALEFPRAAHARRLPRARLGTGHDGDPARRAAIPAHIHRHTSAREPGAQERRGDIHPDLRAANQSRPVPAVR